MLSGIRKHVGGVATKFFLGVLVLSFAVWGVSGAQGLRGAPSRALVPQPPRANSTIWVLPRTMAPASTRRSTTGAVRSETRPRHVADPAAQALPSISIKSFTAIGMPSSGPKARPAR